tara:strand:- start:539 stop:919 length:381 start_codon:yes stop_codon:yes gene_type:complete
MQKLSRRDEAVGVATEDDGMEDMRDVGHGINDPNNLFALLYRKSRLQMKLWDVQKQAENSYERQRIEEGLAPIRAAISALDEELLKNFSPALQGKMLEETDSGVLLTLDGELQRRVEAERNPWRSL